MTYFAEAIQQSCTLAFKSRNCNQRHRNLEKENEHTYFSVREGLEWLFLSAQGRRGLREYGLYAVEVLVHAFWMKGLDYLQAVREHGTYFNSAVFAR